MLDSIDDFTNKIGLNKEQSRAVKGYIKELLVDTLRSMKGEFNEEVDRALSDLEVVEIEDDK